MDYTYMNLIKWLGTFSLENTITSAKELANGDIFAQILYQISPNFFTKFFVSKIDKNPQNNISIKIQNQKLIFKTILEYYTCDSQLAVIHINAPNYDNLVVGDEEEIRRMLQLIIVCAVNCENQEQHIKNIKSLEQDVQHSIMKSITDLMNYSNSNLSNINQSEKIQEDNIDLLKVKVHSLSQEKESFAQKCYELIVYFNDLKMLLQSEMQQLKDNIAQSERNDPRTPVGKKNLLQKIEKLKGDLHKLEIVKDDLHMTCEQLQKDIKDLKYKNDSLMETIKESRNLKDEVDILRENSEKAAKYESTISLLRSKLESIGDFKNQQKILEDKNMEYIRKNIELEEELKKALVYRTQLEAYKKQFQEMSASLAEEGEKADLLEHELRRWKEKYDNILNEKENKEAKILQLENKLKEKDLEYLKKAKCILGRLQHLIDSSSSDLQDLKKQIDEKEKSYEASKAIMDRREQLILSTYHNLSSIVHKRTMEDRLSKGHQPNQQSFLTRQRYAYNSRETTINSPPENLNQ